jgi:hypothetical protein
MPADSASIVSKVWNYAHVLKNAGVGYGDYVEQITYLLFLKLAPASLNYAVASCEMSERGSCQLSRNHAIGIEIWRSTAGLGTLLV